MIKDLLKEIEALDARIDALRTGAAGETAADPDAELLGSDSVGPAPDGPLAHTAELAELEVRRSELLDQCAELTAADRVFLARHQGRPRIDEYIQVLFTDFFEQRGDRQCKDDPSILGGIARYKGMPVTVIGHRKGSTLEENMRYNFGMPEPEGYRKALRLMRQAEKFHRPVVCFVDTSGAFCGIGAEERGQGQAIAENLIEMMGLKTPVISVLIGEGGSGGALALAVADRVWILENAVYSVVSPEGCASILWKDAKRAKEAAECLRLTAQDMEQLGVVEQVISEEDKGAVFARVKSMLETELDALCEKDTETLLKERYERFRKY